MYDPELDKDLASNGTEAHLANLPVELLHLIFSNLSSSQLLVFVKVCRRLALYAVSEYEARLQRANSLDGHALVLQCHHPGAGFMAKNLYCSYLHSRAFGDGEHGGSHQKQDSPPGHSDSAIENPSMTNTSGVASRLARLKKSYSCFAPLLAQPAPGPKPSRRHPAGDIPGTRTHPSSLQVQSNTGRIAFGSETLVLEDAELFSQLCCVANLVKVVPGTPSRLSSIVAVCDGIIRVWREWLAEQATTMSDTSNTPLQSLRTDLSYISDDRRILWVNNSDQTVGIHFRVNALKPGRYHAPYWPGTETSTNYRVEFDELVVKTSFLVDAIDKSNERDQLDVNRGNTVIYGSWSSR